MLAFKDSIIATQEDFLHPTKETYSTMVMVIRVILALRFLLVVHLAWGIHLLATLQALGILLLVEAFILLHCLPILA